MLRQLMTRDDKQNYTHKGPHTSWIINCPFLSTGITCTAQYYPILL